MHGTVKRPSFFEAGTKQIKDRMVNRPIRRGLGYRIGDNVPSYPGLDATGANQLGGYERDENQRP